MERKQYFENRPYYDEKYSFSIACLVEENYPESADVFRKSPVIPQQFLNKSFFIDVVPATFDFVYYGAELTNYIHSREEIVPVIESYRDQFERFLTAQKEEYLSLLNQYETNQSQIKFNYVFKQLDEKVNDYWGKYVQKEDIDHFKKFLAFFVLENYQRIKYYLPKEA